MTLHITKEGTWVDDKKVVVDLCALPFLDDSFDEVEIVDIILTPRAEKEIERVSKR